MYYTYFFKDTRKIMSDVKANERYHRKKDTSMNRAIVLAGFHHPIIF